MHSEEIIQKKISDYAVGADDEHLVATALGKAGRYPRRRTAFSPFPILYSIRSRGRR